MSIRGPQPVGVCSGLEGLYEHWRPQAGWQTEERFSDGTLRLLGLLWAALDGSGPLLLEEPELSLHPEVVLHIPQMFGRLSNRMKRQFLLSTHSEDLLRDRGIAPDEVLMLLPAMECTETRLGKDDRTVMELLRRGLRIADAVVPMTAPMNALQIELFGEK